MTREFDLNIERVLENWTVAHALREVIANALDEQALTGTAEPQIFADAEDRWHIRDWGRGLRYEHLAGLTTFFGKLAASGRVPNGSLVFLPAA